MTTHKDSEGVWQKIALAVIGILASIIVGWFGHAQFNAPVRGVNGETPTGWSLEQAHKFIMQAIEVDSMYNRTERINEKDNALLRLDSMILRVLETKK